MRFFTRLLFVMVALAAGSPLFAEIKNGSIKGTVRLSNNQPAASVSVQLQGSTKGAATAEDGSFVIRNVAPGTHTVEVSLTGYAMVTQTVEVKENAPSTVAITLSLTNQQLQEVIVKTGRSGYKTNTLSSTLRLNEPLLEVPQNVQVVTKKTLDDQMVTSLSDGAIRNVSGLTRLEHWGDLYARINTRGARASAFRNGMNITSTWGPLTEDMSFVDHIEFVKGPAGFMMSNGEPAGIYNVVTKRPTGVNKGEAGFMLGSYDFYRSTLDLDGKFDSSGKLLYRINLMGQTKNSFRPNEFNNRYSIAPVISYRIDDNTVLTAEYVFQHAKMSDVGSYYMFSTQGYATQARNFTLTEPGLDPTIINDQNLTLNLQHNFNSNWKLTGQVAYFNYQQQGTSMWPTSVKANGDIIRGVGIWDASNISKFAQVFLNGNAHTGAVHHRVLVGLDKGDKEYLADWSKTFVLDTAGSFNVNHPVYGSPVNGYPVFDRSKSLKQRAGLYGVVTQQYMGGYVQDELGFFDNKLRLTLAGRYTYVKDNAYNTITSEKKFTPRVGLSYSIDNQTSVYALYDQSFVPQSGLQRSGQPVKPITGNNIEVGAKKDWMGGKWSTSLSIYRIIKNNELSNDPQNSANESFVLQLGQTRSQGIEFDLRGTIASGLNVIANYAYTDSKVTKATSDYAKGAVVPGYAKHTANAWLTYRIRKGALAGLGVNAGFTFLADRTTWSWGNNGQQQLPGYFKLDGGLSYEKDRITITANFLNLLDKYLYSGAYYGYGGYYYWQAEAGRNARLGVAVRF